MKQLKRKPPLDLDVFEIKGTEYYLIRNSRDIYKAIRYFFSTKVSDRYLLNTLLENHIKESLLQFFVPSTYFWSMNLTQEEILEFLTLSRQQIHPTSVGRVWEYELIKVEDCLKKT